MAEEIDTTEDKWLEATKTLCATDRVRWCAREHDTIQSSENNRGTAIMLKRIIAHIIVNPVNAVLQCYGLALATGLDHLCGLTMSEIGERCKVTRQAVSKVANRWVDVLDLPRSRYMKSEASRLAYSKAQKEDHWRRRGIPKISPKELGPNNKSTETLKDDKI